jgi:GxxExxY protein
MMPPIPLEIEAVATAVVDAGFHVHSDLGPGLLELSYEQCLAYEIESRGHEVRRQVAFPLTYKDVSLEAGYRVDLPV